MLFRDTIDKTVMDKIALKKNFPLIGCVFLILLLAAFAGKSTLEVASLKTNNQDFIKISENQQEKIASLSARITTLENEDLRKTNESIAASVSAVNKTFVTYATLLEKVADAKAQKIDVVKQEGELPKIVRLLSDLKWPEAQAKIEEVRKNVEKAITDSQAKYALNAAPSAVESQVLPTSDGFSRQSVKTDSGTFTVTLVSADLSNTKVLTDTGSDGDCASDCTVLSLADYVSRNGGFAGINGSYFCPPDYARCADIKNSFDTLAFNSRLKTYLNSDNNKFSTVPMFVQTSDGGMRFMGQTVEWGRDTGIIGGLANFPLLVSGGSPATSDASGGGGRNFIGVKSGRVYIGQVHAANFANAAKALSTLGMEYALGLDTGGSTALYYNGSYKLGPGRLLPNAIILAH